MEEHKDITVVNLVKNYRSSAGIVNTAVSLIKNNTSRIEKRQEAVNTEEGVVSVKIFKSSAQEAVFVADKIEELRESKPEISIGVLYRMGRCPRILEDELKKRELVYHKNEAGTNYFEEDWVKDILSYFRLASEGGRFIYVAMTRARKELYICGIRKDDFGKKESRFLHELPGRTAVQG